MAIRRHLQRPMHGAMPFVASCTDVSCVTFSAQNFECTTALYGADRTEEPCDVGVATHVFDDTLAEDDMFRYVGQSTS